MGRLYLDLDEDYLLIRLLINKEEIVYISKF